MHICSSQLFGSHDLLSEMGRFEEAIKSYGDSINEYRRMGNRARVAAGHVQLALLYDWLGDSRRAQDLLDSVSDKFPETMSHGMLTNFRMAEIKIASNLGEVDRLVAAIIDTIAQIKLSETHTGKLWLLREVVRSLLQIATNSPGSLIKPDTLIVDVRNSSA